MTKTTERAHCDCKNRRTVHTVIQGEKYIDEHGSVVAERLYECTNCGQQKRSQVDYSVLAGIF